MKCLSKGQLCAVITTSTIATLAAIALVVVLILTTNDTGEDFVRAVPVTTDCGIVNGRVNDVQGGRKISTYRNIPYAVPPLKDLRWKPSTLLSDGDDACWIGEHDGTAEEYIACVNGSTTTGTVHGVEDCLVLSVRTPAVNGSRPVIVWIHGGGLIKGHGEMPSYMQDEDYTDRLDVVTVNINYRLGLMGFMSVDEFDTVGNYANYGLTDQVTALRWVNANIEKFGGDPNSVTIFGEGSGATSVLGLISSPMANNLFHKAIALSPATVWNTTYTKANEMFKDFVDNTGCDQSSKSERLECMQNLDIQAVWNAGATVFKKYELTFDAHVKVMFDFPMSNEPESESMGMAVIDPIVVPHTPKDLTDALFIPKTKVKIILSNMAEEMAILTIGYGLNTFPNTSGGWDLLDSSLKDHFTNIVGSSSADEIMDSIWDIYPKGGHEKTIPADWTPQKAWDTITTDLRATCPTNNLAVEMGKNSNYEIYRLYITNAHPGYPSAHGWDTAALFADLMNIPEPDRQHVKSFKNTLGNVVAAFAYDKGLDEWETYPTNSKVLTNSAPWTEVVTSVQEDQCAFWKENNMDQYGWQN